MTMSRRITTLLLAFAIPSSACAKSIWVLHGLGSTQLSPCEVVLWWPGVVFHNRTAADATVVMLHVSNQSVPAIPQPAPAPIKIPAGTSFALLGSALGIAQYDVPEALGIEGRMELQGTSICALGQPPGGRFTKIRMPVFTRLVPPGEEQVHYGTDLAGSDVRINVGIYNAGAQWANATIAVVQAFCSGPTLTQSAAIPPDTFVQVGLPRVPRCGSSYTVVTVDQPSLSLVSTLSNTASPAATAAVTGGD